MTQVLEQSAVQNRPTALTRLPGPVALGLKFLALVAILAAAQVFIARQTMDQYCRRETAQTIELVHRFDRRAKAANVLVFGDSTNFHFDNRDADKRSITAYLAEQLPGRRVVPVTAPAYHAEMFEACVHRLVGLKKRPRVVVIPVNLRSFSPQWYRCPQYQFVEQRWCLTAGPLYYRAFVEPAAVFKAINFSPISQAEWEQTPVYDGAALVGTVASHNPETLDPHDPADRRKWITYVYMGRLDPHHPYLRSLVNSVRMLRKAKIVPIIYITPVDHEAAEEWYGHDFQANVAPNIQLVKTMVGKAGGKVIDLSFALGADQFTYARLPNEHLKESGRRYVAKQIAAGIAGPTKGDHIRPATQSSSAAAPATRPRRSRSTGRPSPAR